jgi:PAS domain S-box-containing protein
MTKDILAKLEHASKKAILNRSILDVALDGTWILRKSSAGVSEEYDDRFLEIFGYELNEYQAQGGWRGNIDKEDKKKADELMIQHEQSGGKLPYALYVCYTHKDGSMLKILCRGKIIEWNPDGSYKTFVGSHTVLP